MASHSTAFRVIDGIAQAPGLLAGLLVAHARARARFWDLHGAPQRLTIDVDAKLVAAHSENEKAAGNYKHGFGVSSAARLCGRDAGALGGILRPGNTGSNTAADHAGVIDLALDQIPTERVAALEILVRADSAGATHGTADHCHDADLRSSCGYDLTEPVRAAILQTPENAWVSALDHDGQRAPQRSDRGDHRTASISPAGLRGRG